ncbi:hypothetical protein HEP87_20060 [Streptomyces sp. S1D4-11]|nr:hypothetical protein [Streptomyces sp. S1D4-11]QIY95902.1 hypothetical protein HEP87_20060 [Streptomyces sp. S1D4-11]
MDTAIQIGPTGKKLLPLTVKNAGPPPQEAVTRTEVSEGLDRVIEALAGASEKEVAAAVGASRPRPSAPAVSSRTPSPGPGGAPQIISEVEWV